MLLALLLGPYRTGLLSRGLSGVLSWMDAWWRDSRRSSRPPWWEPRNSESGCHPFKLQSQWYYCTFLWARISLIIRVTDWFFSLDVTCHSWYWHIGYSSKMPILHLRPNFRKLELMKFQNEVQLLRWLRDYTSVLVAHLGYWSRFFHTRKDVWIHH